MAPGPEGQLVGGAERHSDTGVSNNPFSTSPRNALGTCPSGGDNLGKSADADCLRQQTGDRPRAEAVPRPRSATGRPELEEGSRGNSSGK